MTRNMKEANQKFFERIVDNISNDNPEVSIPKCVRYIKTNEVEKKWLKKAVISYSFKFSRNSYAILIDFEENEYICLINVAASTRNTLENFGYMEANSGIFTLLGSEGYLSISEGIDSTDAFDKLLYDTSQLDDEYAGHEMQDIISFFPKLICLKLEFGEDGTCFSNVNDFSWLICNLLLQMKILSSNAYDERTIQAWCF